MIIKEKEVFWCFLFALINVMTKDKMGRKDFFQFTLQSSSQRETKAGIGSLVQILFSFAWAECLGMARTTVG